MAHQRQIIREAVKAILLGKTSAGSRIFDSRAVPFRRLELPAIAFYLAEEAIESDRAPRELARTAEMSVEAMVRASGGTIGGADVEDLLDGLSLEIERALHADPTFGGAASDSVLNASITEVFEEGDKLIGLLKLTYSVAYYTYAPAAEDVPLGDLKTVDIHYDLENQVDSLDQAEDRLAGLDQ